METAGNTVSEIIQGTDLSSCRGGLLLRRYAQSYSPLARTSFADMHSGLVDSAAARSRVMM